MLACDVNTNGAARRRATRRRTRADREHVEDDAELRDYGEGRLRERRKELRLDPRGETAEQRRPEENAGEHFADDRRLADGRDQPSRQAPRDHHDRQRQQDVKQKISAQFASGAPAARARFLERRG